MNTTKKMTPITRQLMEMYNNDMTQVAAALGITTVTFRSWMERGIPYIKALYIERKTKRRILAEDIIAETLAMDRKKK